MESTPKIEEKITCNSQAEDPFNSLGFGLNKRKTKLPETSLLLVDAAEHTNNKNRDTDMGTRLNVERNTKRISVRRKSMQNIIAPICLYLSIVTFIFTREYKTPNSIFDAQILQVFVSCLSVYLAFLGLLRYLQNGWRDLSKFTCELLGGCALLLILILMVETVGVSRLCFWRKYN